MDAACRDWQSAIDAAGGLLQKQGVITAEYIQGMKEAVEKYGPYCVFCPGVRWCMQVRKNGVNRFGVSLVKLKEPVRFGHESNDPVNGSSVLPVKSAIPDFSSYWDHESDE